MSFLDSVTDGFKMVAKDQIKAQTDPKILIPNILGVLLIVAGVIVAMTTCKKDDKSDDDNASSCSPWTIYLIVGGIVVLILSNITMALLHPRAYVEDVAFNDISSLLSN